MQRSATWRNVRNQWPRRDSNPNSRLREADVKSAYEPSSEAVNGDSSDRVAPGAARGAALDAYLDALATAFDALPEDDLAAVVAHVQAVASMSPGKRAALLTLTKPEGGAE